MAKVVFYEAALMAIWQWKHSKDRSWASGEEKHNNEEIQGQLWESWSTGILKGHKFCQV